ncbi:MAG: P-type conjugative transfer protein TrbJ [Hyphomicrobiaceae bacterium]|nr:P-type conjugative transfer protein TrbJ [Hyphomicrobiaceae bacterium]
MLNLAEYRKTATGLADYLPWACLVAPGIVLNKDGSFQRTLRYRGPDLDSATDAELVAVSARLNNVLRRFGEGWALFFEAERVPANQYPGHRFGDAASWLVDQERYASFSADGAHHESRYYLTLLYLPPPEHQGRAERLLYERQDGYSDEADVWGQLAWFETETTRVLELLSSILPEAEALDDAETLAYLHGTISDKRHPVAVPTVPTHLDAILCDTPFLGGIEPKLGRHHLRLLTVTGFPSTTTPGLLDALNDLGFAYRWTTRWIALDKIQANRQLTKLRRQWFAKRKSVAAILREVMFNRETALVDSDADNKAADADAALQELGADDVAFGYLTTTLVIGDADPKRADEKLLALERIINGRGFTTIRERLNAVEAWLGSLPGNPYANVRQPIVHTLNLAHMMPVSAVWAGPDRNRHLDAPPLMMTETRGATPFRLDLHCGDVGHAFVVGPTGSGKSVLLSLLALQFRRFIGAQVAIFDRGRSARAASLAMGGERIELGLEGTLSLQPLARIDEPGELAFALEWVSGLVTSEGITVTPEIKDALWTALKSLASAPKAERTLTGLAVLVQSNALSQALAPYTLEGPYGRLLDGATENLALTDVLHVEMEPLMQHKRLIPPVLTYLFHRLEACFDGRPTLLVLDEAWTFLDEPLFAARIREWLKTLRKKNVAVLFATQSLADIERSAIAPSLIESCPTRIFLPNDRAREPQARAVYERFGLNGRQIEILGLATPKRDYYVQSAQGNRLFELGLGPVALALTAASSPDDQKLIDRVIADTSNASFADAFLRAKGLDWAANLLTSFPDAQRSRTTPPPLPRILETPRSPQSHTPDAVAGPEPTSNDDALLERLALFPQSAKPNRAARRRAARGVLTALALALLISTAIPPGAHALTVFDPANYQQNLLSAVRALEQINNQVRVLQHQAQMIWRMDQNLMRLGSTLSPDLQRTLTDIQSQLRAGQGIALKLQETQTTYERLFPAEVSAALSSDDVLRNAKTRWEEEYAGLKRAALLQGQIADGIETDTRLLGEAMTRSRNAAGALEVTQAGNELTGLAVKQSLALQGLLAAQHRAETVSRARDLATEDEARQRFKSFVGSGSGYSAAR